MAVPLSAKSFPAMSPVAVILVTVVDASVDEPVTWILANVPVAEFKLVIVDEAAVVVEKVVVPANEAGEAVVKVPET